ncbi:SDR family oxidoreductase [Temperatibacter marinus]|uniref:SDR family oxidoreductase n=1 Tax=Temperatibacter marinus TaxID=1456591 RepID=A0AA52EJG3_9PROT|nr:SDR family oxidoreductase [Temperatibacter marinus]WND03161.1 SDR family oxidoreductase [Temperatibacter marinus]
MTISFDYTGKSVIVFGGTSGINLGIAESFAKAGARVAVCSRNPDKVNAAVDLLKSHGSDSCGYSLDVRNIEDVQNAFKDFASKVGEIDIVISGAAGNFPAPALGMSANGFKSVVDIDLLGTFHVMQSCFQYVKKPGASVINISAPQAFIPMMMQSHVCAAKAGVDMLTKTLAQEWGGMGVRINSISPGPIDKTEGMDRLAPTEAMRKATVQSVPLERMGEKDDIANAALFLSSDAASYISGIVLPVDGGWATAGAGAHMIGAMMKNM